jgi:GNAT superfamily N-acetyltransferase
VSELIFRRAGEGDAETVGELTNAAYTKWVPVIGRRPKPMSADYQHAVRAHLIELAYLEGELVGLIELIAASDHLLLENLAVAPAHQRKGLGRRLMARAEALTRVRGMTLLRLYTNKAFTTNLAFYQELGYTIEREEPIKSGGFLVHFAKELAAAK